MAAQILKRVKSWESVIKLYTKNRPKVFHDPLYNRAKNDMLNLTNCFCLVWNLNLVFCISQDI